MAVDPTGKPPTVERFHVRRATSLSELESWLSPWQELVCSTLHPFPVFVRPRWVLPCLRTYTDRADVRVAAVVDSERMVGFAPFMIERTGPRLAFLGTPLHDQSTILVAEDADQEVWTLLAHAIADTPGEWE